jgi:hypothetical protein
MRSVIVVLFTIFLVLIGLLVGVSLLEPLASSVNEFDSVNEEFDGSGIIDNVLDAVLVYMPLIVIGGILLWAVRWVLRRERVVNRR